jgi:hypothetical protein
MRKAIALAFIPLLLLAGCARPTKETTIIERPVAAAPAPAAVGATAPSCTYASQAYSQGSVSCQDRTQFRCENGIWNRTFTAC